MDKRFSEGDRVIVSMSDAEPQSGTVVWVQEQYSAVGIRLDRSGRTVHSLVFHVKAAR